MYNSSNYVTYAIVVGEDNTSTNNLVYITSDAVVDKTYVNKDTGYVYTYNCIIAGEETTVQVKASEAAKIADNGHALYKMTYDANGYAKKVELKGAQAVGLMNTAKLEEQGYFVTANKDWTVTADGATLYVKDVNNNASYVILDDECNYFVYNAEGEEEYVEFADVAEALNETGNANKITGTIVVLADTDSGYATTVIIYDAAFEAEAEEEEEEETAGPAVTGDEVVKVTLPASLTTAQIKAAVLAQGMGKMVLTTSGTGTDGNYNVDADEAAYCPMITYTSDGTGVSIVIADAETGDIVYVSDGKPAAGNGVYCINLVGKNFAAGTYNWTFITAEDTYTGTFTFEV